MTVFDYFAALFPYRQMQIWNLSSKVNSSTQNAGNQREITLLLKYL